MHLTHLANWPYQDYFLLLLIPLGVAFVYFYFKQRDLNVKDRTVGDGQYGTARWINEREKEDQFERVVYDPKKWRSGKRKNLKQGLIWGMDKNFNRRIALLDTSDSNSVLVGPSGIGKTN